MERIGALIRDAEQMKVTSESLNIWIRHLKDVAYRAEDTIEEYTLDSSGPETMDQEKVCGLFDLVIKVCGLFDSILKRIKIQHTTGSRIREIRERMDEILNEGRNLLLPEVVHRGKIGTGERLRMDSYVNESKVYGRENDKNKIIEMLLANGSGGKNLSVIPILGMGGLGKTTLAQLVYNDEKVANHFQIKIWVCVSDDDGDFDVMRLLNTIIEKITMTHSGLTHMEQLQIRFRQLVEGKRYLIVLDDVWNEVRGLWEKFEQRLSCGDKGSKIVVTTRSQNVVKAMGATTNSYSLNELTYNDCWTLFVEGAFGEREEDTDPSLIEIGKEMVKKCKGVPLAAKTLGGLMRCRCEGSDLSFWMFVRDNQIWELTENDLIGIFPALRLSYIHLSTDLKRCFAYCSIFPKDYKFEKQTLIQQWIAAGFIPLSLGGQLAEDIGSGYFNDLLGRSFFQDVETDDLGLIEYCKMHDLVHDLATSVAKHDCLILGSGVDQSALNQIHFASWLCHNVGLVISEENVGNLRAFLHISTDLPSDHEVFGEQLDQLFSTAKRLRILSLIITQGTYGGSLPDLIGNLRHLRFLDLSSIDLDSLPTSITSLKFLQTLKLGGVSILPQDLSNMVNLRHLDIRKCNDLTCIPPKIGKLTSLQTLPRFIVGKESGCGIEELQNLQQLQGDIRIDKLENVGDFDNASRAKLKDKLLLRSVGFYWSENESYDGEANRLENAEDVLEGLQPPKNLKRLWVINYSGVSFPSWLMNPLLPCLVNIVLYNCKGCEILPPLGQLPHLKILIMNKMCSVKCLDGQLYGNGTVKGFPCLKTLVLRNMPNLKEWSEIDGINLFPCLEKLIIEKCDTLKCLPRLSAVTTLELYDSNAALLGSVGTLASLSFLGIELFLELESLPKGVFLQNNTALQALEISKCPNLKTMSMQLGNLTTMKSLLITDCSDLASLQGELQNLISLELLKIHGCHSLTSFPSEEIQGLTSLSELWIEKCDNLTSLPQGLQYLTSLNKLTLMALPKLVSLPEWDRNIASLLELKIKNCPHLVNRYGDWLIPEVTVECGDGYNSLMSGRSIGGCATCGNHFFDIGQRY